MYPIKNHILLFFLLAFFAIASCTKAIIDEETGTAPITRTVTFKGDVENIMFNHCITCHGGPAPSGGFGLTTYEEVRFYGENGSLVDRMNDLGNPMPPSGLVSIEQRQLIEKWVADGFPEE